MKTLTLTEYDVNSLFKCDEKIGKEVLFAIFKLYFTSEFTEFDDPVMQIVLDSMLPKIKAKKQRSEAGSVSKNVGNKFASKQTKIKRQIKRKTNGETNEKQTTNQTKQTDTQRVTSDLKNNFNIYPVKENEKEEERKEFPPNTPLVENKEEEKVKEKEEIQREDEDLTFNEKDKAKSFEEKMKEHYPRVMSMKKPLTHEQYRKLVNEDKYKVSLIKETLEAMENSARLHKDYISSYLTLRNWIKQRLK